MDIIITRNNENEVTARLIGRLDTPAAPEAAARLDGLVDGSGTTVILDCTDLSYISSSGLRIFLTLRKEAAAKGSRMVICNICNDIRNVFMMTGFLNLFEIR